MVNSEKKYKYVAGMEEQETTNKAIAARYDAQHRFFAMGKLKQTMAKMSGKYKKFKKLWSKAVRAMGEEQDQVAEELNKLFR